MEIQKKVFVNRSSVYVNHCQKALPFGTRERERGYSESWTFENVLSNYSSVQLVKLEEQHDCNWSSSWFSFGGFWFGWFCDSCGFGGLLFSFLFFRLFVHRSSFCLFLFSSYVLLSFCLTSFSFILERGTWTGRFQSPSMYKIGSSLNKTCNEYLIKFSENQSAPKLENRKTSPCSSCAPNLLHVLVSLILGYHNLCSPGDER